MRSAWALLSCLLVLLSPASLAAQASAQHVLVATQQKVAPVTQLLDVDLARGKLRLLGRFKHDGLAPLAMAMDPIRRDLILAQRLGSLSRLLRIGFNGTRILSEQVLADVQGEVRSLVLADLGDIFVSVAGRNGGIHRIPRNGGTAKLVSRTPRASGMTANLNYGHSALIVQSGSVSPVADPGGSLVDLRSGKVVRSLQFKGLKPLGLTGVIETPTALVQHFISNEAGRILQSTFFSTPKELALTPKLPAGATRRIRSPRFFSVLVLGGAAHPHLKTFTPFGLNRAWKMLAGPLPGDPVDFDFIPISRAAVLRFGPSCSLAAKGLTFSWSGTPVLGSQRFFLNAYGAQPSQQVLLLLGTSSQQFGKLPLPIRLPGTCELLTSVEIILVQSSKRRGQVFARLPVPNQPALSGRSLFAQFLEPRAGSLLTSEGGALHLFPQ